MVSQNYTNGLYAAMRRVVDLNTPLTSVDDFSSIDFDSLVGVNNADPFRQSNLTCRPSGFQPAPLNEATTARTRVATTADIKPSVTIAHIVLGIMALSPHSFSKSCEDGNLLACMANSWLPRDLDVLTFHDCTAACQAAGDAAGRPCTSPVAVHHAPYEERFGGLSSWARGFRFHRRCFYAPLWGDATVYRDRLLVESNASSPRHNWAKLASLLLAMHDLFADERSGKRYFIKIDSDTTVEPSQLLHMLSGLDGSLAGAPPIAFGNWHHMHVFSNCTPSKPLSQCQTNPHPSAVRAVPATSTHAAVPSRGHCLRGTLEWLAALSHIAWLVAAGDRAQEQQHIRASMQTELLVYPAGMLYGLSTAALRLVVSSQCIERVARGVMCVERLGAPSTLLEDTSFGLCLHLHGIRFVQCDCFATHLAHHSKAAHSFRCMAPISVHPLKRSRDYLEFNELMRARARKVSRKWYWD